MAAHSPTLHDTRFVAYRWWNDGWIVKTVITGRSSASMVPAAGLPFSGRTPYRWTIEAANDNRDEQWVSLK